MANKPRILLGPKDLIWSLIPLMVLAIIIAGLSTRCSFSPGGPKVGPVPSFDAHAAFRADAATLTFPVREPAVPAGWAPNSGSKDTIGDPGGGRATTVGYITDGGRYLALVQSNASEQALARHQDGELVPAGTEQIAGHTWVVYGYPTKESAWITDLGDVRVLIHGAGSKSEYTALAQAVVAATPIVAH